MLEPCSPSEQGIDPAAIVAFIDALDADPDIEPHGLIIQRHGRRIAEGYWAPHTGDQSRLVYSLSKTFTGTALALLLGDGRLTLDDLVSDHLPELLDGADERTRHIKVRHLASLATGHDRELILETLALDPEDPVRGFFSIPPDHEPGTWFTYNQPPVLALATLVQRLAGERLSALLRPRVLDPLGIGPFTWSQARPGLDMGFSGVHTNLDAIARLGQLYLDDGVWDGQRLLPEGWVSAAGSAQIDNPREPEIDWRQGYGFMLWQSRHGYRGDGAFGQYMVVLPEHDTVIGIFSCIERMQTIMDLMWDVLLPAMSDTAGAPTAVDAALAARLDNLTLPTVAQRLGGGPPLIEPGAFEHGTRFPSSHGSVARLETSGAHVVLHEDDTSLTIPLTEGWTTLEDAPIAASATTLDDGRLAVDLTFLATPHRLQIEIAPTDGTFGTRWPLPPLFGGGLHYRLSAMRAPTD